MDTGTDPLVRIPRCPHCQSETTIVLFDGPPLHATCTLCHGTIDHGELANIMVRMVAQAAVLSSLATPEFGRTVVSAPLARGPARVRPNVGVAVVVRKADDPARILVGRRLGRHGQGTWSVPGGWIEGMASASGQVELARDAAVREAAEEAGLTLYREHLEELGFSECAYPDLVSYTIFFEAVRWDGWPENREPAKCAGWEWHPWDKLPAPLFGGVQALIEKHGPEILAPPIEGRIRIVSVPRGASHA